MSDAVTVRKNGKAEMAYVGEVPWHGLGESLEKGASIETWQKAAGMDWRVCRSRVRYGEGDQQRIFEDNHVLFRSDSKEPLGIVSPKFKVVHPGEVLEFFRDLTESAGFTMETAGTLFGGRRFWALAHIGETAIIVNPADVVGGYLLLSTGCDGTLATTAKFTTVRVVCNNTLSMALANKQNQVRVEHRSKFDASRVKDELGIARGQFAGFVKELRNMATTPCSEETADLMTRTLVVSCDQRVKAADRGNPELLAKAESAPGYKKIMALFGGEGKGAKMDAVSGTTWGWLNAVTEYVDYHVKAQTVDNRLDSAWFGRGDMTKNTAMDIATQLSRA